MHLRKLRRLKLKDIKVVGAAVPIHCQLRSAQKEKGQANKKAATPSIIS